MEDKFEAFCEKYELTFDKIVKNYDGDRKHLKKKAYEEIKYLFNILYNFMAHQGIGDVLTDDLLRYAIRNGGNFLKVFSDGLTWTSSAKGYEFFYFLNLKWLEALCKMQPIVPIIIEREEALGQFENCIDYADAPHDYNKDRGESASMPIEHFRKRKRRYIKSLSKLSEMYDSDIF